MKVKNLQILGDIESLISLYKIKHSVEFYLLLCYDNIVLYVIWEVFVMTVNYNKLWTLLTEKGITKTQMQDLTGIRDNTLTKLLKNEAVSIDILLKIATTIGCGLDDIVTTSKTKYGISSATLRNWEKLNTDTSSRLTKRANKRKSKKRILPLEYISNKNNISFVQEVLDYIDKNNLDIFSVIFSLGISLLQKNNIYEKKHVATILSEYSDIDIIDDLLLFDLPNDEFDILGLIYQAYLQEGAKNIIGSYYTPSKIAYNMTKSLSFSNHELFLDPCCGSGSFLLSVPLKDPNQIYGVDNDKIAVLISKINMLIKYKDKEFIPQIYCFDFLKDTSIIRKHPLFQKKFDYIVTNPPWGAMDNHNCIYDITSKETFSYFFVKSYERLKKNGMIKFLFPEAILNVKTHKDIRQFILDKVGLISITKYDDMFSGVTTKYVDIECGNRKDKNKFLVYYKNTQKEVSIKTIYETENLIFNLLSEEDLSIVQLVKNKGKYSLKNSIWALGIVTGDNKGKLFSNYHNGLEKIYTGKEIQPYTLLPCKNYILYDRASLQQTAKDEIYRAKEKLVYKFVSNRLVFAYDDSASLFLNSANILIPSIPSMSMKTIMAFLNSTLFQFMYIKLFGEIKILKGNLMELPFPEISSSDNEKITALVDAILKGDIEKQEVIDRYIFAIYGLTEQQISYIRRTVDGKIDSRIGETN